MQTHNDTQAVFALEEGRFGGAESRTEGFCAEQESPWGPGTIPDVEDLTDHRRGTDGN